MPAHAATPDLNSVDLSDLNLWADGPPHELFARMRSEAPVHRNASTSGAQFWSLTRAADIAAVSADSDTFSTEKGGIFLRPDTLIPLELGKKWVIFKDPPEHTKHRQIVAKPFMARSLVLIDEHISTIIKSVLDKVAEQGECDLVKDVAVPIPLMVMSKLLGSPEEDLPSLLRWNDEIEAGITNDTKDGNRTMEEMAAHFRKVVGTQMIRGLESLAGAVANAEVDGDRLTDEEIAVYFAVLLFTGTEHTRNTISNSFLALLENPDQLAYVQKEPTKLRCMKSGLAPPALEELLRWTSTVNYLARTATKDTTVGGTPIKAGERVVLWYASANRDPEVFENPDVLDLTRTPAEPAHYAFGGGGPHHCQGAGLANRMVSMTLMEVLKRFEGLELAGPPVHLPSTHFHALKSLPVRFKTS